MHSFFLSISRMMAWLGGAMLSVLVVLTCVSVLGRALNGAMHSDFMQSWFPAFADWALSVGVGPVNGDFELIEAGVAFAIFAFLPLCQITGGHATVDVFTTRMPDAVNRWLRVCTEIVFAAVLVLISVQLWDGMQSKLRSGQTTQLIEFPVWWAYAGSLLGAVMAAIVAVYLALARVFEMVSGRVILPIDPEAGH